MHKTWRSLLGGRLGWRLSIFVCLLTTFFFSGPGFIAIASAQLSQDAINSIINNTEHYDASSECDTSTSTALNANSAGGSASGYPIRVPVIKDPQKLADAINAFIYSTDPTAPLNGKGEYFVQGGMRAGINPILVVTQARNESGFGKRIPGGSFNAYGRTASDTQPNVSVGDRLWYKYESWEKSLVADAFPASGKKEQPDDQFQYIARRYAGNLDSGLQSFLGGGNGVPAYAPAYENDLPAYIKNLTDWTNQIVALAGGAVDMSQVGTATTTNSPTSTVSTIDRTTTTKVIALDPGHGGVVNEYTDPVTKLGDRETPNSPEREDMQDVANIVKAALEKSGYTVVLLKTQADESISKRDRINAAEAAHADLGISLHTDSGWGPFESRGEVWPQFVGGFRQSASDPNIKVTFTNEEIANLSNSYADIFVKERDAAERDGSGKTTKVVEQSTFGKDRGLPSYGNISLMQLWAKDIPWVYNEAGAPATGLTDAQKLLYASGIINGVEKSLPLTDSSGSDPCASLASQPAGNGDVIQTALLYAWPVYKGKGFITMKPEYSDAVKRATKAGLYIGGKKYPGVDCGGFVTRVMLDSGYEPGYNSSGKGGYTAIQLQWIRANWQSLGRGSSLTTAQLQPGDVAFRVNSDGSNDGHTFMYVGTQQDFGSVIASASLDQRAPMAGHEDPLAGNIEWFRKK